MNRNLIIGIAVVAAIIGGLFAMSALLNQKAPDPDPTPTSTVDVGPAPSATSTTAPEPEPTVTETPDPGHDDENHDHGEYDNADCAALGPDYCPQGEDDHYVITEQDRKVADAVRGKVKAFVAAFTTVTNAETPDARTARLKKAGADPTVAEQDTVFARTDSGHTNMTRSAIPRKDPRTLLIEREDGLLKFQVSITVDAKYTFPDDSVSVYAAGGTVYVWVDDRGTVKKLTEDFPTMNNLR